MAKRCRTCHFQPCRCVDLAGGHEFGGPRPANWPLETSFAAGCLVREIPKRMEQLRRKGVRCEFKANPDGMGASPVFESPLHRKAVCEAMGLADNNGGYHDPQPRYS